MAQENLRKKCSDLITPVASGPTYAFIRKIDQLIHAPEIEQLSWSNQSEEQKYKSFLDHQRKIYETVRGCEIQVFNDPRAFYVGKTHLDGVTGTMSTILTNGYLWLYNTLLEENPELEINPDVDLRILLNLVGYTPLENGQLKMPAEELQLLRSIVAKLLPRRTPGANAIFTPGWYEGYENTMNDLENFLTANYIYYRYNQGRQKYGIEDATQNFQEQDIVRRASESGYLPRYYDNWRLWETHPPYVAHDNLFGKYTTDDTIAKVIPLLKTIFPPTPTTQVNTHANNNTNNRNRFPNNPNNSYAPAAPPSGQVQYQNNLNNPGYVPNAQINPPATVPTLEEQINEIYPPASVPPTLPNLGAVANNPGTGARLNTAFTTSPPSVNVAQGSPNSVRQASGPSNRSRKGGRSRRHKKHRKQRKLKTRRYTH